MPRFEVGVGNPYRVKGVETHFETEIWECCRPWEIVARSYTWDASMDAWKGEQFWVRTCGLCGNEPRPRLEDRLVG